MNINRFTAAVTDQGVASTNNNYGGYNPKVTRVISIHGTIDPWHSIGLYQDVNDDAPTIIVEGNINYIINAETPFFKSNNPVPKIQKKTKLNFYNLTFRNFSLC